MCCSPRRGTARQMASRSSIDRSLLRQVARVAEKFPTLQRDGHIPVFPKKIVECAQVEFFALLHSRVGEKFHDLQFSDLVSNRLTGTSRKSNRFLARGLFVHRDFFL